MASTPETTPQSPSPITENDVSTEQHSGRPHRPINEIDREATEPDTAATELEAYKVSLRRYAPVQKGLAGLPWEGQWHCAGCGQLASGQLVHDPKDNAILLELDCPRCGNSRERQHDVLFTTGQEAAHHRQPRETRGGSPIHPILGELPKTVETLCPECSALILGRSYEHDGAVWMEKSCPEHGYFRDKVNSDVKLYKRISQRCFQDERGVVNPQVKGATACPTDCGLCNQHHSSPCLSQIDLSNRCNLTCPVCFASANQAGYLSEPSYEMVVEMLRTVRESQPIPVTGIQFTGGEPTIHPEFFRIVKTANEMGFTHVQAATNGIKMAEPEFAAKAAEAGLHTIYLQFDGTNDELYRKLRGKPLLDVKRAAVESCRKHGIKICLVPTIMKGVNDDQIGPILRFAADNSDVINAISYQPVSFCGRVSRKELEAKRYTLGDLAHDIATASGADVERDFYPANLVTPLSRFLEKLDGKPKIRTSCHSDCGLGTYFFVAPNGDLIPIPRMFDLMRLFDGMNELSAEIEAREGNGLATRWDLLRLGWVFLRSYRWGARDLRITPWGFMKALRSMTNKKYGRGAREGQTYRTVMAAGMHFMDRYNYDTERVRRCVILYSTPDGLYPFCTINSGPTYRPYIEAMHARPLES
jgi:uncharacterized radical SAM superfamily Fe-S cluster-containing enzyme